MIKKVMISQPMAGRTEEEIKEARAKAVQYLESNGYRVVDTYISPIGCSPALCALTNIKNKSVWCLGKSIHSMAYCDLVFFCKGWENARGCRIEHEVAQAYGLDIMYEESELRYD